VQKLATLAEDSSDRVRFQLALTLTTALASDAARAIATPACVRLAIRDGGNSWIAAALLSGSPDTVGGVLLPALTRDAAVAQKIAPVIAKLIEIRAASRPAEGFAPLIDFVARSANPLWLRALGEGLKRAGTSIDKADAQQKLAAVFTRAAATAADGKAAAAARLEAIEVLGVASFAQSREALIACLAPRQPAEVQIAAIKTLATHSAAEVAPALLRSWPGFAPKARDAALTVLMAREERAVALLEAVGKGAIKPTELSAAQVESLAHSKNKKIAGLATTALASVIPPSREEVAAKFQPAAATRGDATRGHTLYQTKCIVCHRAGSEGMAVGPDLITVKTKGRDGLLTAILDPHKEVAPQYIAYDVTTKDGNAYTGLIARDDATSLSLKIMGGAEISIPRANVKGSSSVGKSLMPEGLEAGMTVQDMADLLTFIEELK
jgi:putative heme-binding domain-containing protein